MTVYIIFAVDINFFVYSFAVCDPVLGDNGHLYVPESLIPIYQKEILPLSDICKPNQFEAEILTGIKINSEEDAWKATDWFHAKGKITFIFITIIFYHYYFIIFYAKGVRTVVLSSTNFAKNDELIAFLSQQNGEQR